MIDIKISTDKDIQNFVGFLGKGIKKKDYIKIVEKIVNNVKEKEDIALFEYTKVFDNFDVNFNNIRVSDEEFEDIINIISQRDKEIIEYSKKRIEAFHKQSLEKTFLIEEDGIVLGSRLMPVEKAGLYIPSGKAAYPSTALMTIIPAVVASVPSIYIVTPAGNGVVNPYVLYAAYLCGVKSIYKIGGAQSIAALAYGTNSVPKVDVIAGPGNIYVALAKKIVYGDVGIDSIAGPSEIAIVADQSANPKFVACDLLSQIEHDELAKAYLISVDNPLINETKAFLREFTNNSERKNIIEQSSKNIFFIYAGSRTLASKIVDVIAPEHLELQLNDPFSFMNTIRNAGAIFIGDYTPESIGDYIAGPNHTLPTNQTARFSSPLSCETFMKRSSIIYYTKESFLKYAHYASDFAQIEGLFAHKQSIEIRLNENN